MTRAKVWPRCAASVCSVLRRSPLGGALGDEGDPPGTHEGGGRGKRGPRGGLGRVCATSTPQQAAAVIPCVPPLLRNAGRTRGTARAAGSAPSLCTRWTPARTPTPTSCPRRRPATSTRSSVSAPRADGGGKCPPQNSARPVLCLDPRRGSQQSPSRPLSPAVHNVKPECLDAYNSLT